MVISLIDEKPIKSGWGQVYQSGEIASLLDLDFMPPGKKLIVSMAGNMNLTWPTIWMNLHDDDTSILSDEELLALTDTAIAYLSRGIPVLIHCFEGKYRSTYIDVAVHMRAGMSFHAAYALVIQHHMIARLRAGTFQQLKQMEATLKGDQK